MQFITKLQKQYFYKTNDEIEKWVMYIQSFYKN